MKNAHTITRIALATAVIAIPAAWAQNALDANPQVGSTGSNSNQPTRIYGQGVNTNLMITGNTTGGTAFPLGDDASSAAITLPGTRPRRTLRPMR